MTVLRSRVTDVHLALLLDCTEKSVQRVRRRKALPVRPRIRSVRRSQVWIKYADN